MRQGVQYEKQNCDKPTFDMRFSLGKINTMADLVRMLFTGNPWRKPQDFMGLEQYYNALDPKIAQNAVNVIDGGGRYGPLRYAIKDNLTSIYLVNWSAETAYIAYHVDQDGELFAGIVPHDWRYISRACNLDENSDLQTILARMLLQLPRIDEATTVFYMNRRITSLLYPDTTKQSAATMPECKFRGFRIRLAPLHNREAQVE